MGTEEGGRQGAAGVTSNQCAIHPAQLPSKPLGNRIHQIRIHHPPGESPSLSQCRTLSFNLPGVNPGARALVQLTSGKIENITPKFCGAGAKLFSVHTLFVSTFNLICPVEVQIKLHQILDPGSAPVVV